MVIYRDQNLYNELLKHPGLNLDEDHPTVTMKRYAKDGLSVFKLEERDAILLYQYYENTWNEDIQDEFGDRLHGFQKILGNSYCESNLKLNIRGLVKAQKVERELLKNTE